jgi:hypothetical protein
MSSDCLFCKIVAGSIPAKRVFEDELCICFADLRPQAPTHLLIVPRQHIASLAEAVPAQSSLLGHLLMKLREPPGSMMAIASSSTPVRTEGRPSITFTCICWADDRWAGLQARLPVSYQRDSSES